MSEPRAASHDEVPSPEHREPSGPAEAPEGSDIPHSTFHIPHSADPQPLAPALLREIVRQAEAGYPREICGLVIGRPGESESYVVRGIRNVADEERPADVGGARRDARNAYLMDPQEELRVLREMDERGWDVVCIYHSHPDHDAYFSAMDRDRALDQSGRPLWPRTAYLVVSVRDGRARDACYVSWHERLADFVQRSVPLPAPA